MPEKWCVTRQVIRYKLTSQTSSNAVAGENDLKEIHLKLYPSALNSGTLKLEAAYGGSLIKVWESPDKGTEVKLPKTWTNGVDTVPEVLYVEGITASISDRGKTVSRLHISQSG